jgi:hypothetical protein
VILPIWVKPAAGLALLAVAYIAGMGTGARLESVKTEKARTEFADARAAWANERAAAEQAERAKESQREDALRETARLATLARTHADADRRAADAAHRSLLDAARSFATLPASPDSPAAAGGEAAAGPGLLLANVLGGLDEAAGELAAALDQARIAGLACERAYAAIEGQPQPTGQVTP